MTKFFFSFGSKPAMFEYFELIKNKDIEPLRNLFSPDAIVYEPFSKLREGVSVAIFVIVLQLNKRKTNPLSLKIYMKNSV